LDGTGERIFARHGEGGARGQVIFGLSHGRGGRESAGVYAAGAEEMFVYPAMHKTCPTARWSSSTTPQNTRNLSRR
jgi:hypothetical protein